MSTEALLEKIVAERDKTIAEIEAATKEAVVEIEASTEAEVATIAADAAAASEKQVAQITRAELSKARQAGKLLVQSARREVFDEIMSAAQANVATTAVTTQSFADKRADLEMHLAKQIG